MAVAATSTAVGAQAPPYATGDGQVDIYIQTGYAEFDTAAYGPGNATFDDDLPFADLWPGTDPALGLPYFDNTGDLNAANDPAILTCTAATPFATETSCGNSPDKVLNNPHDSNQVADRYIIEGYVLVPAGVTTITLAGTNEKDNGSCPQGSLYFYAQNDGTDSRVGMDFNGGGSATFSTQCPTGGADPATFEGTPINIVGGDSACASLTAVSFRVYVYNGHASSAGSIAWKTNLTSGFEAVPAANLSTVAGYDNDLDDNGIADALEADIDGDGIPDFTELNDGDPATDCLAGPELADDISSGNTIGDSVTINVLANDPESNLDPTTVGIIDPATGLPVTGLVVPGEGLWAVDLTTGAITFTPDPGFEGDPTPIDYTVTNTDGESGTATVTIDYVPVAADDESLGNTPGSPVTVDVLANDGDIDPTTVAIDDPNYDPVTGTLVVPGEGTWTVDPATGEITFTPEPGFVDDPTPISYLASDDDGNEVGADVTVGYIPVLEDDESLGNAIGAPVTVDVLGNDPSVDIDPTTVMITDPATGLPVTSLVVPGEGTWTVDPATGAITFTPEPGFEGDPTPITYTAEDADGNVAEPATVTVDYIPSAQDDESLGNTPGSPVTVDVLGNDGDIDPTTVMITDPATGLPVTSLVVPGEGTWTVDPATGEITFTPEPGFEGNPTPITYTATDDEGSEVSADVVVGYTPVAEPDDSLGNPAGSTVTIDVVGNDPAANLDPTSVAIVGADPTTGELVVPGEGTWTVDPATGEITFTPEPGFVDDPTPISYTVSDDLGQPTPPVDVVVTYAPVLEDDVSVGNTVGEPVIVDVLGNDPSIDIDPTTVMITDPATGLPVTSLVVPGEGTWSVDPATGAITFTPEDGFEGNPTPISYTATDTDGFQAEPATVTVGYGPVALSDESLDNAIGSPVTIDVLGNDPALNLDPTSVMILDANGNEVAELVVAGEGTWTVDPATGEITFTPEAGFEGDPTPIEYVATDVLGQSITPATVTVDYVDPVVASTPALALTGIEAWQMFIAALLAIGAGMGLTMISRREHADRMHTRPREVPWTE